MNLFKSLRDRGPEMKVGAFGLWVVSLALPAFGGGGETSYGYTVLLTGFLGALAGMFAWYANPLFFWLLLRRRTGKTPWFSSLLAIAFALQTFTLSTIETGAGSIRVYGLGWGAVLWVTSIALMVLGTGLDQRQQFEAGQVSDAGDANFLVFLGGLLVVAVPACAVSLAIADRASGNASEAVLLRGVAYKRGAVCKVEEPVPTGVVRNARIVQVVSNSELSDPRVLLKHGAPVVRIGDHDYTLRLADRQLVRTKAAGAPDVVIEWDIPGYYEAVVAVKRTTNGESVFRGEWRKSGEHFCPSIANTPAHPDSAPFSLVLQTLGLSPASAPETSPEVGEPRTRELKEVKVEHSEFHPRYNAIPGEVKGPVSCDDKAKWLRASSYPIWTNPKPGLWFSIGDAEYMVPDGTVAYCDGDYIFLIGPKQKSTHSADLPLEKRRLSDFGLVWRARIPLSSIPAASHMTSVSSARGGKALEFRWFSLDRSNSITRVITEVDVDP